MKMERNSSWFSGTGLDLNCKVIGKFRSKHQRAQFFSSLFGMLIGTDRELPPTFFDRIENGTCSEDSVVDRKWNSITRSKFWIECSFPIMKVILKGFLQNVSTWEKSYQNIVWLTIFWFIANIDFFCQCQYDSAFIYSWFEEWLFDFCQPFMIVVHNRKKKPLVT